MTEPTDLGQLKRILGSGVGRKNFLKDFLSLVHGCWPTSSTLSLAPINQANHSSVQEEEMDLYVRKPSTRDNQVNKTSYF